MMNSISKICAALTTIFAVSMLVLVLEIVYVLLRGRRSRARNRTGDLDFSNESAYSTPPKELLYLFCCKNQASRIEPDAETSGATGTAAAPPLHPPSSVSDLDELMKQHALSGPSRALFTIKEEEREELETDLSYAEREERRNKKTRGFSMEEVAVAAVVIDIDDSTPFSTPCSSPPYYTPSPSPPRDKISPQSSISDRVVLDDVVKETKKGNNDTMSLHS